MGRNGWDGRSPTERAGGGGGSSDDGNSVPVGTTGYTIASGYHSSRIYSIADFNAVIFGSMHDDDDYPRQYVFSNPEAGIYWGDGTVDATGSGVNLYLVDNETLGLFGGIELNGTIAMFGGSVGDPATNHSTPQMVGVRGYTTTTRNSLTIAATGDHYMVFDTTLGKPIWSDGSGGWVDATGTSV